MTTTNSAIEMMMLSASTEDYIGSLHPRTEEDLNNMWWAANGSKSSRVNTRGTVAYTILMIRRGLLPVETVRSDLEGLVLSDVQEVNKDNGYPVCMAVVSSLSAKAALKSLLEAEKDKFGTTAGTSKQPSSEAATQAGTLDDTSNVKK